MTIGDVLAVVAGLSVMAASWVALLLLASFLFSGKASEAASRVEAEPVRCMVRGLVVAVAAALLFIATTHLFVGPARLLPYVAVGTLMLTAIVGSTGIVQLIARRSVGRTVVSFTDLLRASSLYTLAGVFPVAGWFLVTPLALFVSLGAALPALIPRRVKMRVRTESPVSIAPTVSAAAMSEGI